MKNILRNLILSLTLFVGAAAFGQPAPPYTIEINGRIPGFSWNAPLEYATITSLPGTEPAISVQALIFPSNDARFGVVLNMNTFVGGFDISVPCNGSTVTTTVQYVANAIPPALNILYVTLNCGTLLPDCELVLGGSAHPATPCDDGIPSTLNTFWNAACQCINIPDSIGVVTVSGTVSNCSGAGQLVDIASTSSISVFATVLTDENCSYTYTFYPQFQTGSIEATTFCNNAIEPTGGFDSWGPGNMNVTIDLDCGNGPAPCQACFTVEQAYTAIDTLPFTALFTNCSSGGVGPFDYTWSFDGGLTFEQLTDTTVVFDAGTYNVCLMMTSADGCVSLTCDTMVVSEEGIINPGPVNTDCEAGFWVIQAYDSTASGGVEPIPNELWIWNLSTGSGNYQFTWDFGDGTTSIEPYPTHVYSTSGPYLLCLTLLDDAGCTSTYCDSLTLDEDGIYNGLVGEGNSRAGFTLNVLNELPNAIDERETLGEIALWPNPATDVIVVSMASMNSTLVEMSIIDLNGRMVQTTSSALNTGNNKVQLPIGQLDNGLYLVRISDGRTTVGHRFVKQ